MTLPSSNKRSRELMSSKSYREKYRKEYNDNKYTKQLPWSKGGSSKQSSNNFHNETSLERQLKGNRKGKVTNLLPRKSQVECNSYIELKEVKSSDFNPETTGNWSKFMFLNFNFNPAPKEDQGKTRKDIWGYGTFSKILYLYGRRIKLGEISDYTDYYNSTGIHLSPMIMNSDMIDL